MYKDKKTGKAETEGDTRKLNKEWKQKGCYGKKKEWKKWNVVKEKSLERREREM